MVIGDLYDGHRRESKSAASGKQVRSFEFSLRLKKPEIRLGLFIIFRDFELVVMPGA